MTENTSILYDYRYINNISPSPNSYLRVFPSELVSTINWLGFGAGLLVWKMSHQKLTSSPILDSKLKVLWAGFFLAYITNYGISAMLTIPVDSNIERQTVFHIRRNELSSNKKI